MKKLKFALALLLLIFSIVFFVACEHETPQGPCETNPLQLNLTATAATVGQQNGTITANAAGGSNIQYSLDQGPFGSSNVFSGLAGNSFHTVVAKNESGCEVSDTITVPSSGVVDPCAGVTITVSITAQTSPTNGQSNGSISVSASGGGTSYTYSIDGTSFVSGNTFNNLAPGTYTITAKNADGCTGTTTVTLVNTVSCTGVTITVTNTVTNITPCVTANIFNNSLNNGSISASATGSSGFTFSKDGVNFQASGLFGSLTAGNYTITAKDVNGCTGSAPAVVAVSSRGPLFTAMRNLINSKCGGGGCHLNGSAAFGYNFDDDCSIIQHRVIINSECQSNSMPRPPLPPLTTAEKAIITNWINAGGGYTN